MTKPRIIPLDAWPGEATDAGLREYAKFTMDYQGRLELLKYELERIEAREIVLQMALSKSSIRANTQADGWPAPHVRTQQPGVVLTFTRQGDTVPMSCDLYRDWRDNLLAIAKSLEALRGVERWGVIKGGAQYVGLALPPAPMSTDPLAFSSPAEAAAFLAKTAGKDRIAELLETDAELLRFAYTQAARKAHPDAGGDEMLMTRVNAAHDLLKGAMK